MNGKAYADGGHSSCDPDISRARQHIRWYFVRIFPVLLRRLEIRGGVFSASLMIGYVTAHTMTRFMIRATS
jgi:hypothetical protein